jgi:transposase
MAHATLPARVGPPDNRKNINVHLTADFRDDLAELMRHGQTATDAIRAAVRTMADAHRRAHDYGDVPHDTAPRITQAVYAGEPLPCGHRVGGSAA